MIISIKDIGSRYIFPYGDFSFEPKKESNMFKREDIKAGYMLECDNGMIGIVNYNNRDMLGVCFWDNIYLDMMNFDDNLYSKWRDIKINKIYGRTANGFLHKYSKENRELLWNRNSNVIEIYVNGNKVAEIKD